MPDVNINNYSEYLRVKIQELWLSGKFWAGWILFWATVVNWISELPSNCVWILDIEPFAWHESLKISDKEKKETKRLASIVNYLWSKSKFIYELVWRKKIRADLVKIAWETLANIILDQIEPRTFFKVWQMLLELPAEQLKFNKMLPHVLIVNPEDDTLDAKVVQRVYKERIWDLMWTVFTQVAHYPKWLTTEYFEENMEADWTIERALQQMFEWEFKK